MKPPKVCVVIPTRERADTLAFTLKTCVAQDYENLEILVCDNFSGDDTEAVVASFSDSRVRYLNSGRRLSMAENWEFALSTVEADFVTVIGDDDGLLPQAISDLISIIRMQGATVVTWKKVEYCWPNHIDDNLKNYLSVPLRNKLVEVSSRIALAHIYKFWMSYARGPCIYNSLVSMRHVKAILDRDGVLFNAACPDVYSSLALASVTKRYLYSTRPFSINGASAHSNGTSVASSDQTAYEKFLSEMADNGSGFLNVHGSISAAVADSLVQFKKSAKVKVPKLYLSKMFSLICTELAVRPESLALNREVLMALADNYGQTRIVNRLCRVGSPTKALSGKVDNFSVISGIDGAVLWGDRFDIADVSGACQLVSKVLGGYKMPDRMVRYSIFNSVLTRLALRIPNFGRYLGG